VGPRQR